MKKNWKIIIGAIFLIGGFGCIGSDMDAAIFGIVVGVVFTAWWLLSNKKISSGNPSPKARSVAPTPPTRQSVAQSTQLPAKSPRPTPISDGNPLPKVQSVAPAPPRGQPVEKSMQRPTKTSQPTPIPREKDGAPLAYKYSVPFVPSDQNAALLAVSEKRNQLTAKQIGKDVHLFSEETDLGILTEKSDMVADWIKRNDPVTIILERPTESFSYQVTLAFYRDKQKYNAHREQTVFALTGYKSEAKQNTILYLNSGDELEAEEDFEKDGRVTVSYLGDVIGSFPKKYADQFIDEGAALVVFDHGEELEDSDVTKPFVRVYW